MRTEEVAAAINRMINDRTSIQGIPSADLIALEIEIADLLEAVTTEVSRRWPAGRGGETSGTLPTSLR